jgi:hypothetical protein
MRAPEHYQYELNLRDITEVWRRHDTPCWSKFEFQVSALSSATDMPTVEQLQARANYLFY